MFDQGLGDLFVVRVAGNIVSPAQLGSVECAAAQFGTRLVVVLGHSECGAVRAAVDELLRPTPDLPSGVREIVTTVRPAVERILEAGSDPDTLLSEAVRANIDAAVEQLQAASKGLEALIRSDRLRIVGAEYSLKTGVVEFIGDVASCESQARA